MDDFLNRMFHPLAEDPITQVHALEMAIGGNDFLVRNPDFARLLAFNSGFDIENQNWLNDLRTASITGAIAHDSAKSVIPINNIVHGQYFGGEYGKVRHIVHEHPEIAYLNAKSMSLVLLLHSKGYFSKKDRDLYVQRIQQNLGYEQSVYEVGAISAETENLLSNIAKRFLIDPQKEPSRQEIISYNIFDFIHLHHELFSGKGYPFDLRGFDIPFIARFAKVLDVFQSITKTHHIDELSKTDLGKRPLIHGVNALLNAEEKFPAGFDLYISIPFVKWAIEEKVAQFQGRPNEEINCMLRNVVVSHGDSSEEDCLRQVIRVYNQTLEKNPNIAQFLNSEGIETEFNF